VANCPPPTDERPALLIVGHGSRSSAGVDEYWKLAAEVKAAAPDLRVGCGFIELAGPDLDTAIDDLVAVGATSVVAVPLVLLGAGHMKNDGPSALRRARGRHPQIDFRYGRDLGINPTVLGLAEQRIREVTDHDPSDWAVVVVSRGSSDPDANSDLFKVARLLWDRRGIGWVEPAFVSLVPPDVPSALDRCVALGGRRVAVVSYFLFTGILVERISDQTVAWAASHPDIEVRVGAHLGPHPLIAKCVLERFREAGSGDVRMNCDLCVYRVTLPGYENAAPHNHHHHDHHDHHDHLTATEGR